MIEYFTKIGQPVFRNTSSTDPQIRQTLLKITPVEIARLGFLLVSPFKADK